jgi:hypothetical protein
MRRASGCLDRGRRLFDLVGVPGANDHRGACIGEPQSNRFPEASTGPRDDRDAVVKIE